MRIRIVPSTIPVDINIMIISYITIKCNGDLGGWSPFYEALASLSVYYMRLDSSKGTA